MKYEVPPAEGFTLHLIDGKPLYLQDDIDITDYESYCKQAVERDSHVSVCHHRFYEKVYIEYRKYARRAYIVEDTHGLCDEIKFEFSYVPFVTVEPVIFSEEQTP